MFNVFCCGCNLGPDRGKMTRLRLREKCACTECRTQTHVDICQLLCTLSAHTHNYSSYTCLFSKPVYPSAIFSALSLLLSKQSSLFLICNFFFVLAQGLSSGLIECLDSLVDQHILRQDVRQHMCGWNPLHLHHGSRHQRFCHGLSFLWYRSCILQVVTT